MHPIPPKLRKQLQADPFMHACIYGCPGKPEWEHAFTYAGKQIQEDWAIVPCCYFHHRGAGFDKSFNRYIALLRATPEDLAKYPKTNWHQLLEHLTKRYVHATIKTVPKPLR